MNRASTTEPKVGRTAARFFRSPSLAAGVALGLTLLAASLWWWPKPATVGASRPGQPTLEELKRSFARPSYLPQPADNPATPAKLALGQRLFEDKRLSVTGTISCSSCHDPKLAFTDGESSRPRRVGTPAGAPYAFAVERRLEPASDVGRSRLQPGGPDPPAAHPSRRDGRHLSARGGAARRRCGLHARLRRGLPRLARHHVRDHRQGARRLRALAGVAADPLRPMDCRRPNGPVAQRAERLCHLHGPRPLHQLPHRLRLHRPRLL